MELDTRTFDEIRDIVYAKSGITLSSAKVSLVSARVGKRMRALGIGEFHDYLQRVKRDHTGEEMVQLLDAISTNVTQFFREPQHFNLIQQLFKQWLAEGQTRFRFWCAACSTGEEPYSLAMTLSECLHDDRPLDIKILATDISTRVLDEAAKGEYLEARTASLPKGLRGKYFELGGARDARSFIAKKCLKDMIVFKRFNLSLWPFPMRGPMDIILCRNVMIYFDNDIRRGLLAEMYRLLKPGGYLLVGHAESLTGLVSDFRTLKPSVFTKGRG